MPVKLYALSVALHQGRPFIIQGKWIHCPGAPAWTLHMCTHRWTVPFSPNPSALCLLSHLPSAWPFINEGKWLHRHEVNCLLQYWRALRLELRERHYGESGWPLATVERSGVTHQRGWCVRWGFQIPLVHPPLWCVTLYGLHWSHHPFNAPGFDSMNMELSKHSRSQPPTIEDYER